MKRLLCIIGSMDVGGAETFIMKLYRKIDKDLYQIDFAVGNKGDNFYADEIYVFGGKIFPITPKSQSLKQNVKDIWHVVKQNNYKYVLRVSQHSLSGLDLLIAKMAGAKICAFRSSNTNTTSGKVKENLLHYLFRFLPKIVANVKIAPSSEAANFMFGKSIFINKKVHILKNAIDLNVYKYNGESRELIRKSFNIDNCFVIGHVGRFYHQKNHSFLLKIFLEVQKNYKNSRLLLVGTGELEDHIKQEALNLGIYEKIIFSGLRSDIPQLLSAMDVMVFPSLYEGLPNSVIEAQATRLPCFISTNITKEVDITGLVSFIPLSKPPRIWASHIMKFPILNREIPICEEFKKHKYDIENTVEDFIHFVFKY